MGKLTEFLIVLNTQRQVFYPGEQIVGQVVLNLNQPMDMKGIKMEFEGIIQCVYLVEHRVYIFFSFIIGALNS